MKKLPIVMTSVAMAVAVSACSGKPDCGSSDGEKLIAEILRDQGAFRNLYILAASGKMEESKRTIANEEAQKLNKSAEESKVAEAELKSKIDQCVSTSEKSEELMKISETIKEQKIQLVKLESAQPGNHPLLQGSQK
jgi:hypothetical protein